MCFLVYMLILDQFLVKIDSPISLVKMKAYAAKSYDSLNVWYFQNSSTNATLLPPAPKGIIKSVSLGASHKIGLTSSGFMISWQITSPLISPKIIEALFSHNITSIACGPKHVLAVSDENKVFSWGYDTHGCLGHGETTLQILPKEVEIFSDNPKPEHVFCGPDCSFILTDNKVMLACGNNRHNKLALDSGEGHQTDHYNVFTLVCSKLLHHIKIKSVSAGRNRTVVLSDNDEIYSVGSNQFFQLGWGQSGSNYNMPGKIEKLDGLKFLQISCPDYFTLAVTGDHSLYCWGKCPKSLNAKKNISYVESPLHFTNKSVLSNML